jgi:DNA-3-methyladenine glycosylase II
MPHRAHIAKDKKMKALVEKIELPPLAFRKNPFIELVGSIMSQQLSVKVADVIYKRFLGLYNNKVPSPQQVLDTPVTTLRSIGLSNQKAGYIHNIARFALEQGMELKKLKKMDDESLIAYLTQIKGVGRWTVEMLMMFCLCREDIFSMGDYGLQSAIIKIYKLDTTDKKALAAKIEKISIKWSPYRTYASMYLWRWKDNSPK